MTPFEKAIKYLFINEGSAYTNDPKDSGGPTKYGVTQRSYAAFLKRVVTPEEIEALSTEEIKPFYFKNYWEPLLCYQMEDPAIATALFDSGVLYGLYNATDFAQKALGACGYLIRTDRFMGPQTLALLNLQTLNRDEFIKYFYQFVLRRIAEVVRNNPKNEKYLNGWVKRAERLLTLTTDPSFNKT